MTRILVPAPLWEQGGPLALQQPLRSFLARSHALRGSMKPQDKVPAAPGKRTRTPAPPATPADGGVGAGAAVGGAGRAAPWMGAGRMAATRLAAAQGYAQQALAIVETLDASAAIWKTLNILATLADRAGQAAAAAASRRRARETFAQVAGNRYHSDQQRIAEGHHCRRPG